MLCLQDLIYTFIWWYQSTATVIPENALYFTAHKKCVRMKELRWFCTIFRWYLPSTFSVFEYCYMHSHMVAQRLVEHFRYYCLFLCWKKSFHWILILHIYTKEVLQILMTFLRCDVLVFRWVVDRWRLNSHRVWRELMPQPMSLNLSQTPQIIM